MCGSSVAIGSSSTCKRAPMRRLALLHCCSERLEIALATKPSNTDFPSPKLLNSGTLGTEILN